MEMQQVLSLLLQLGIAGAGGAPPRAAHDTGFIA